MRWNKLLLTSLTIANTDFSLLIRRRVNIEVFNWSYRLIPSTTQLLKQYGEVLFIQPPFSMVFWHTGTVAPQRAAIWISDSIIPIELLSLCGLICPSPTNKDYRQVITHKYSRNHLHYLQSHITSNGMIESFLRYIISPMKEKKKKTKSF